MIVFNCRDVRDTKHSFKDLYPACFEDVVLKVMSVWFPQLTVQKLRNNLKTWMQRQHNGSKK